MLQGSQGMIATNTENRSRTRIQTHEEEKKKKTMEKKFQRPPKNVDDLLAHFHSHATSGARAHWLR